jgi:hypothetical protein
MSEKTEPDKKTYEELLAEIDKLKNKCDELTKENKKLISKINYIRDEQGYEISEFFFDCYSLKITAEKFFYDDIVDCGNDIIHFQGCPDAIQCAKDYKEYCSLAYGDDSDEDDDSNKDDSDDVCENNNVIEK